MMIKKLVMFINTAADHTNAHDQNHDAREAQGRMCNLGDVERFTHDQDGDGKELLERLCEVDAVARLLAEEAEEWVAVTAHRIARGVHVEENLPQGPTAEACEDTEDDQFVRRRGFVGRYLRSS
ncbi:hypothetical protein KC337_g77 [Hortaea werneckii]|nr:hypothetical protein KC337_g77 [Hortaea werneckii]